MSRKSEHKRNLAMAVEALDMDGVLYELVQIAIRSRDAADAGSNPEHKKHTQAVVEILIECQQKLEAI